MANELQPQLGGPKIIVRQGNIVEQTVDVVVNAANADLELGDGVAGAFRQADRSGDIQRQCQQYVQQHGRLKTGDVAVTDAGSQPQKRVIHAVGPMYRSDPATNREAKQLALAIRGEYQCLNDSRLDEGRYWLRAGLLHAFPCFWSCSPCRASLCSLSSEISA